MKSFMPQARSVVRGLGAKLALLAYDESGMSTVEYAKIVFYTPDA